MSTYVHIELVNLLQHPSNGAVAAADESPQRGEVSEQAQPEPRPCAGQLENLRGVQQLLEAPQEFYALVVACNRFILVYSHGSVATLSRSLDVFGEILPDLEFTNTISGEALGGLSGSQPSSGPTECRRVGGTTEARAGPSEHAARQPGRHCACTHLRHHTQRKSCRLIN